MKFLDGLDGDLKLELLKQLRDEWTHTSTTIEGNTLTLGETKFVIAEGLTIKGKSVKDHQEVIGHAKAIDIMYSMLDGFIHEKQLFDLHNAVQASPSYDIYQPNGAWKVEPNGTYVIDPDEKRKYVAFSIPRDVPALMNEYFEKLNLSSLSEVKKENAPAIFAKFHVGLSQIHPFWDGNGRLSRLVSNIPLLKSGLPPIIISNTDRKEYIDILSKYSIGTGTLNQETGVWPDKVSLDEFTAFCERSYVSTWQLVDEVYAIQKERPPRHQH